MDYKVNYEKILTEGEPVRLRKMEQFLTDVSTRMTIENPLSILFLAVVEHKLGKESEAESNIAKSRKDLGQSAYWQERFSVLDIEYLYELTEAGRYCN